MWRSSQLKLGYHSPNLGLTNERTDSAASRGYSLPDLFEPESARVTFSETIKSGWKKNFYPRVRFVHNLIRRDNFNRFLFGAASVAISLMALTLTPGMGKSAEKIDADLTVADASPGTAPANAHDKLAIGVDEWLTQERIVFLSGKINPELAKPIISRLLYLDHQSPGKDIYLYINSPGGEITAGLAIYDTIRSLRSDVVTVGIGEASSMASILLASGAKGKRTVLPNTRVMIHQPWSGVAGQASDIAIVAKEVLHHRNLLNHLLSSLTGQPLKRIEVDSDRDFYMSAQEAKVYGIVDQEVTQPPSASRPLKD